MSKPTYASALPVSAVLGSFLGRAVRERPGERRRVLRASGDREQRLRAEAGRRRFMSVCRREFLRRDAEPGRGS